MASDVSSFKKSMQDSIIYIRSPFSLERDLSTGRGFVEDARAIIGIPHDRIEAISEKLNIHTGFLDSDSVSSIVAEEVEDESVGKRLSRIIVFLDSMLDRSNRIPKEFLDSLRDRLTDENNSERLSDPEIEQFFTYVTLLIKDQPGFKRHRKAERLYDEIGIPVRDVKFICDLRPVFDKEHVVVEGMILVTTLKVLATDVNGLPITLEAKLTDQQVADLAEKAEEAKKKLSAIRELMNRFELPMPSAGK